MHRKLLVVFAVLALLLPVAATNVDAQDEVELRWRTRPDNQAEADVYAGISDTIDAAWDGVTLKYEPGGSETASYQDVLIAEVEAGTAPDVFWIPGTDVARFAKAGLILNLHEQMTNGPEFNVDDFYPGPMTFLTTPIEGDTPTLWGVPRDVSTFAIYYNADLFDEAGLDYPAAGWTWDDFFAAAKAIDDLGEEIKGYGANKWWAPWGIWVNSAGGRFFTEDYKGCALNTPETVEGMKAGRRLFEEGIAVPWGTDSEPPFLAGTVGMYLVGRWATPGIIANAKFNWNVAPPPAGPGGSVDWLFWGAYVVNAKTEHPAEAWDLITRLTSADIQGQVSAAGTNIPSRRSQDAIDLFLATLPDSGIDNAVFTDSLAGEVVTEAPLFFGDWPAIDQAMSAAVDEVYAGTLSPEDFAATICDKVAEYFEK